MPRWSSGRPAFSWRWPGRRTSSSELESRFAARQEEARQNAQRQADLRHAIEAGKQQLDLDLQDLERLRVDVRDADERLSGLRQRSDVQEGEIRDARKLLDLVRGEVSDLEVARVAAESDLTHLASTCVEAVQATLDQVLAEVEAAERDGQPAPGQPMADEPEEEAGEDEGAAASAVAAEGAVAPGEAPVLAVAAAPPPRRTKRSPSSRRGSSGSGR